MMIMCAIFYGFYQVFLWGSAIYDEYHAMYLEYAERKASRATPIDEKFTGYMNILAVGIDDGGDGMGPRADAVMVISLEQKTGKIRTISIPRGTLITVNGSEPEQVKMIYEREGIGKTLKAVRGLLGVTVHQYVVLDKSALRELVDAVGGVDLYVETKMDYEDPEAGLYIHIPQGYQHMDGDTAQKFLRYRSGDLGDIGRVQRQHRFIRAMYDKVLHIDTLAKLPDIAKILQERVNTSVEVWDTAELANMLKSLSAEEPEAMMLPGQPMAGDETAWLPDGAKIKEKMAELFPEDEGKEDKK